MSKELKEDMNKCLNEDLGNTNSWSNHENNSRYKKRINKEVESLKKKKLKENKMKISGNQTKSSEES